MDSSEIIKNNILTSIVDKNIPSELKTRQVIGFDLETNKTFSKLLRYNGNYEPKTRDIIKFNLNELFKYEVQSKYIIGQDGKISPVMNFVQAGTLGQIQDSPAMGGSVVAFVSR